MKFTLFAICCFIITMHCTVQGGLVKDFFGKVKETAEVIHKDVKQVWRPESDDKHKDNPGHTDGGVTATTPATMVLPSAAEGNQKENTEVPKITDKTPDVNEKKSDEPITPATTTAAVTNEKKKPEETTTVSSTTPSEKDGRENFAGGCTTGYKRTSDGRCMPTF